MAIILPRSAIPADRVKRVIDYRIAAFVQFKGRNPNETERAYMVHEVTVLAKKINLDRGVL